MNPLGEQLHALDTHLSDWKALGENRYAYNQLIPDSALNGIWTVSALSIKDSVGNLLCLNSGDSALATFAVAASTSISEEIRPDIYLYPNPSSGIISWSMDPGIISYDVYNQIGETIISNKSPEYKFIDLSHEAPGLYLIRFLCSGDQSIIKRVLIY
jgi:hypothetical protein